MLPIKMRALEKKAKQEEVTQCLEARIAPLTMPHLFPFGRGYQQPGANKSSPCWRNWQSTRS